MCHKKHYIIIIIFYILYGCNTLNTRKESSIAIIDMDESIDSSSYLPDSWMNVKDNKKIDYKLLINDSIYIDDELFYIVEGDLLYRKSEFNTYIKLKILEYRISDFKTQEISQIFEKKIIILKSHGVIVRLNDPSKITYCIIKQSFTNAEYDSICIYLTAAANQWKDVCNINFIHRKEMDSALTLTDNPDSVFFVIKKYDSEGKFIAKSFFPNTSKKYRKMLIDQSYFSSSLYDKTGLMRHEFGHVMGFLHEHIRSGAPSECPNGVSLPFFPLTDYDPQSVMHYFCNVTGFGNEKLFITNSDIKGAKEVYPY